MRQIRMFHRAVELGEVVAVDVLVPHAELAQPCDAGDYHLAPTDAPLGLVTCRRQRIYRRPDPYRSVSRERREKAGPWDQFSRGADGLAG